MQAKEIIRNNEIQVKLVSIKPSFLMYPLPLLQIGHKFKWKARFIVGTGYLYALCFNGQEAKTSFRELKKVLSTNSTSRVQELLSEIETLNRYVSSIAGSEHPEKFVKTSKNGTEIELILPQDFSLIETNRTVGFFPVPKISFLMPTSAQAKALYIYMHYLKNRDNPIVTTSANRLGKDLRLDRKKIKEYLSELQEINAISFESNRNSLKIIVKAPIHWKKEAFIKITEIYGEKHPFLRDWKFERCTNRPQPGAPIDPNLTERCTNRPQPGAPIDPNLNPAGKRTSNSTQASTTSITTSKKTTTSIYDDIYNGGGKTKSDLFNSETTINKMKKPETESEANRKTNAPSYTRPNGLKNKKKAGEGELGKSNKAVKLEERIDKQELEKIKKALSSIADGVQELLRYHRIELVEDLYKPLKEIYGKEWKTIAGMYELYDKKEPKYGYSRKTNTNYLGLLISFALKDSQASFWDFYDRFKRVFGVKEKERKRERRDLFEKLKDFLKKHFSPTLYKTWIEEGLIGILEADGIKVVKCRDWIVKEYLKKHYVNLLSEFLGSYGTEWKFE